ncbi:MAG: TlpA disulfide reductase family protein [Pseudomonadota bacterium]
MTMLRRQLIAAGLGAPLLGFWLGRSSASPNTPMQALDPRPPAPEFNLPDPNGKAHKLADYRGKLLIVNFWATWCAPCRKEMPSLQRLWKALRPDGVELVAIDFGDTAADVAKFGRETALEFPLLLDPTGNVLRAYGALGLPTTYVLDRSGRVVYKVTGDREWDAPDVVATLRGLARTG